MTHFVGHVVNNIFERAFGLPVEKFLYFGGIGRPSHHILESSGVGLFIRDEFDFGGAVENFDHLLCELHHGDGVLRADIINLSVRLGFTWQFDECAHGIGDVAETPGLLPGAEYSYGLAV